MISLFLIGVIIILIYVVVEIAATALKMTGLDIHTARFQALSAITGTGFTTKETELVMGHRQRRGIVMVLMVIGPICLLGLISSLLISMREEFAVRHLLSLLAFIACLLLLARSPKFVAVFHRQIEKQLKRYRYPRKVQLEEVLQLNSEYGVCEFKITPHSHYANKSLKDSDLKEKGYIVLAIERGKQILAVPAAHDIILPEDILVIFGNVKGLKTIVNV